MSESDGTDNTDSFGLVPTDDQLFPKPELASAAAKRSAARPSEDDLARILRCGDFGGQSRYKMVAERDTEDGEDSYETEEPIVVPCERPSSFGIPGARYGITPGKCYAHSDGELEAVARQKAKFLDTYVKNPENGIKAACAAAGFHSRSTVYWWKDQDPEFRRNMEAIDTIAEAILTDQVEELVFDAIREWRPGAGVLAQWYLANRRSHKWKSAAKASGDSPTGTNVNVTGGQHIWKIGDHEERM